MANGGKIEYTIGFNVDKSGLNQLQAQLNKLMTMTPTQFDALNPGKFANIKSEAAKALNSVKKDLRSVQTAFNTAFDTRTGQLNLQKLSKSLGQLNMSKIAQSFKSLGAEGEEAFFNVTKQALITNTHLIKTNTILDRMGKTLVNTLKWSLSSGLINRISGSIQQAVGYVEHLDSSLNDIRIVTKKSADEMNDFANNANKAAQALGKATTDYTEASLIYYQQGLSDEEVKARAETTLKAANVTGQATSAVSEQLTAVWNGFKVNAEDTEKYVDKLAAVAAMSASNLEELSTGMSKVASAASNLGVDIDQLTAQISTIVSVTRQAPESVGTALKTIYARISDLKLGESDEDGLGLGDVSGGLQKLGINVLDAQGELRDLGTVIEEVAAKWDTWTSAQQAAVAQLMAGKRQYNNLVALFSNWDLYENAIDTSRNATGELQKQQDIYMESTEAHLQQLKTQWENLYDSVINTDMIKGFTDSLKGIVSVVNNIVDAFGGGQNALLLFGSTLVNVFSKQIGNEIGKFIINMQSAKQVTKDLAGQKQILDNIAQSDAMQFTGVKTLVESLQKIRTFTNDYKTLTQEGIEHANALAAQAAEAEILKEKFEETKKVANEYANTKLGTSEYDIATKQIQSSTIDKYAKQDLEVMKDLDSLYHRLEEDALAFSQESIKGWEGMKVAAKKYKDGQDLTKSETKKYSEDILSAYLEIDSAVEQVKESLKDIPDAAKGGDQVAKKLGDAFTKIENATSKQQYVSGIKDLVAQLKIAQPAAAAFLEEFIKLEQEAPMMAMKFENAGQALNDFLKSEQIIKTAQDITKAFGQIGQMAAGFNSIKNIGRIFSDEDISTGEKLIQIISSIGMGFPMMVNGIKGVVTLISTLSTSVVKLAKNLIIANLEQGKQISLEQAQAMSASIAAGATLKKAAADAGATIGLKANTKALAANTAALIKNTLAKIAAHPLIAAGVVALGALTYGIIAHTKALADQAKQDKAVAEHQQKRVEKATEEKEVIDKLLSSYQEILASKEDDAEFTEEQTNKIYELVKAYGDQELIIQALSGDYEKLEESIKKAQRAAEEEQLKELQSGERTSRRALISQIKDKGGATEIDSEGYDFTKAQKDSMAKWREDLAKVIGADPNAMIDDSGHISYDNLVKILTAEEDKLNDFLDKHKNDAATEQIESLLSEHADLINQLRENQKSLKEAEIKDIGYNIIDDKQIQNLKEFDKNVNAIAQQLFEKELVDSYEAGKETARNFLAGLDSEYIEFEKASIIIDQILTNVDPTTEEALSDERADQLREKIDNLNSIQKSEIASRADIISGMLAEGKSVDEIFSNIHTTLEDASKEDQSIKINAILNETSKKKIKENLDALFADASFDIGISQETFQGMDKSAQQSILIQKQYELDKARLESSQKRKEEIENLNTELDTLINVQEEKIAEFQSNQVKSAKDAQAQLIEQQKEYVEQVASGQLVEMGQEDSLDNLHRYQDKYIEAVEQIADAYMEVEVEGETVEDVYLGMYENLSEEAKEYIELLANTGRINAFEDDVKNLAATKKNLTETNKTLQKMESTLESYKNSKEDINDLEIDYVQRLEDIRQAQEELNKSIDTLQKSYQSLQDVITDYNEDGYLTLDNLQSLLTMDSSYLATLELENGQLKMNDEAYGQLIQTELHMAEVEATLQYIEELLAISKGENVTASQQFRSANNADIDSINQVIAAANQGTAALMQMAAAKDAAIRDSVATKEVTQAYYNKMQLIKNVASQSTSKILGKSSSSSKGKSSGGSSKEPKTEKYLEREEDIYRVINQELSQIEATLGRIDTIASHEWGADYRDTLKEQNELLDKQLEKQKEKNKLQKSDLSYRRKQLEQEGVTFSEDGSVMTNAEQVLNQLYAGYNAMVDKYNKMSASDQEVYKAQMDTEKNRIDAIEKKIDQYESTYSDFQSTLDDILDTHYKIIENEVNQFNNEIEIKLELSNARKEWNEFWAEIVEDVDDNDFGKKIALDMQNLDVLLGLGGNDKGTVGALTKHLKNIVSEVNKQIASADEGGNLSIFGDDTNASHEALQKYISELMTAVKDSEAAIDDIADNYLNTLESAQDKIDEQLDGWEAIGKQINHDVDLIKLLTPDNNYDALDKQYQKQYELNQKTLKTQRMSKEFWAEQMKINKASMEQFTEGSKEWKAAEKAYEKSVENFKKANDTLNEGIEKSLEDLQTLIENLNDQAIYKLDKALSDGLGLDLMEEEWKLINDEANKYYDNVERYINMEDYTNVLNEAANAVGLSAANQQKLNDFRDQELKQLSERNKLTSYDIEESKARLEILKAQMALEDVQRNKSNMRLRRDSQGNYNYQYTANEDQVDEADNRLLTARKSWYEIVKKRYQETTEDIINLLKQQTDLAEKMKEAENAKDAARLAKYTELWVANEKAIEEAYIQAEKNKRDMYTGTAQYFANVVDRNMLKQSETTARKLVDTWASGGKESVTGAISEAYTTLRQNQEDFVKKTDVLLAAAKVNYENLRKEGIDPTVDSLEDLVESNEKLDEELTHINDTLSQQIVDLANAAKGYEDLKKAAVDALEDANKAMETLSETVVKSQEDIRASIKATQEQVNSINYTNVASSSSSSSSSSSGSPGGGSIQNPTPSVPQIYTVNAKDRNGFQLTGYPVTKNDKGAAKAEMRKLLNQRQEYSVTINGPEGLLSLSGYMSAENERKLRAYKTGGYTGSWGSEGRLAVLHEKELVLNASDTRNILSAVELLRALPFSALAQSIVDSSSNIAASFRSGVNMNGIGGGTTNNETKSMVVNADFSGVRSADEIYQALIELENYGLQNSYSVAPHANTAY